MNGLILKEAKPVTLAERLVAQRAREDVIRNAIGTGFAGLGLGMTARGIQGLLSQWGRTLQSPSVVRKPSIVDIPVADEENDEVEKMATDPSLWDYLTSPGQSFEQLFTGARANTASQVPFSWVPAMAAGAGSTAVGWKGMDILLDRAREKELEEQERKAKEEYERALTAQSKLGQALHAELDTLYDRLTETQREEVEKAADLKDMFATGTNIYGLYALLAGVPAAVWAYESTRSRQQSALLEKARKKYMQSRESTRPSPVFIRAAPIQQGSSMKTAPDEEELEGAPLDKAAGQGLIMSFAR